MENKKMVSRVLIVTVVAAAEENCGATASMILSPLGGCDHGEPSGVVVIGDMLRFARRQILERLRRPPATRGRLLVAMFLL